MNGFIGHILDRHLSSDTSVTPRLPGRFEPPAVPSSHSWRENLAFPEPIQPNGTPTEVGDSVFNRQRQNVRPGEPPIVPDPTSVEGNEYAGNEDNPIPSSVEHRVTRYSDASADRPTNEAEFVPLNQSSGQFTAGTLALNPVQAVNALLIYEPTPSIGHVTNETQKNQSDINPNGLKSNLENDGRRPVHPVSVVIPAARRPADLRFGASSLQDQPQPPPVIKVSIGRIEVKAVQAQNPVKTARTESPSPKMSLDEYLNKRNRTH